MLFCCQHRCLYFISIAHGLNVNEIRSILYTISYHFGKCFICFFKGQISHWFQKLSSRSHIQGHIGFSSHLASGFSCILNSGFNNRFQRYICIMEFAGIGAKSICQHNMTSGLIISSVYHSDFLWIFDIPCFRQFSGLKSLLLQ